jgi:hypothetical protein
MSNYLVISTAIYIIPGNNNTGDYKYNKYTPKDITLDPKKPIINLNQQHINEYYIKQIYRNWITSNNYGLQ